MQKYNLKFKIFHFAIIFLFVLFQILGVKVMAQAQTTPQSFYVDPDFAGVQQGTASNPWVSLGYSSTTPQWTAINSALANGPVTIYFSSREADSDIPDEIIGQVNVARSDLTNTNRLTLDGMNKYNTNDTNPSWADYSGSNKTRIKVEKNSFSIGWEGKTNRQNYVTIRGFEVTGNTGRITFKGSHFILENIWSHDIIGTGATIQLNGATDATCANYGREQDIIIRNNLIERGFGEGLYIGGNYPARYGGCDTYGLTHDNILIENNTIRNPGTNGGEGDSIDIKVGLTNVTIRNNTLEGGPAGNTRGIIVSGLYLISGVNENLLIEGNRVFNRSGKGIEGSYLKGAIIRNNLVYNNGTEPKGISLNGGTGDSEYNTDVQIYNNTVSGGGIGVADANGITLRNNLILNLDASSYRFNTWGSTNIDSDYNIFPLPSLISSVWVEGAHSISTTNFTPVVSDSAGGNFHLISSSPAIDKGVMVAGLNADFDQVTRSQGSAPDIGAYEYVSSSSLPSDTTPPSAPSGVIIN